MEPKEYAVSSEQHDGRADEITGEAAAEHGQDRPARRSRLTVVAVAVAVLLAGGGGAYWATSADNGGSGAAHGGPAPLRLDSPPREAAMSGSGVPGSHSGSTFQLTGTLPKGPRSAPVYRAAAVDKDTVKRLAEALGVRGPVVPEHGGWRAGVPVTRGGPTLLVDEDAPGTWSYTRRGPTSVTDGSPEAIEKPMAAGGSGPVTGDDGGPVPANGSEPVTGSASGSGSGAADSPVSSTTAPDGSAGTATDSGTAAPPVSERKAKAVVAPVLDRLGMSDARVDAGETIGDLRMVAANPTVGGLPTQDWAVYFQVGRDGVIMSANGRPAELDQGDTYPVVTAAEALKQLNAASPVERPDYGIASCAMPEVAPGPKVAPKPGAPYDDTTLPRTLPCAPGDGHPVQVRGARFGLAMEYVAGVQTLVPAWLFDTAPAGVSRTSVVAEPAVDPSYIRRGGSGVEPPGTSTPGAPVPPDATAGPAEPYDPVRPADPRAPHHAPVVSYRAGGSTLTLTFWGGVCDTYRATADETGSQVRVLVTARPLNPGGVCTAMAKEFSESVTLDKPLGDRSVLDATSGQTIKGQ
jgi:hypothetical protein